MSNELTRLLPCPFCGGAAHVVKNSFPPNTPWRHPSCGTEGCPGEVHEQDEQGGTNCDCRTDAQAIALWNRRALSDHAEAGQPESEREPIATVIDNNQVWWTNIIETAPGVTLLVGTKLYAHPPAPRATERTDHDVVGAHLRSLPPSPKGKE